MKEQFDVTGMTCSACSARIEKCISKLPGVHTVSVNLLTNSMQAEYDTSQTTTADILSAVSQAGYGATVKQSATTSEKQSSSPTPTPAEKEQQSMQFRLLISISFLLPLMYLSMGHMIGLPLPAGLSGHENAVSYAFTQFLLALPIAYINRNFYITGFRTLAHGTPNMDSLIAIGSSSAFFYGIFAIYRMSYGLGATNLTLVAHYHQNLYFESAVMILTLITFGKYLESRSKGKTSEVLRRLLEMAPKTALVLRNETEQEIPIDQVLSGDTVLIKPGRQIPVDGIVLEGRTVVDQSAITGESIPVEKNPGDTLISASVNKGDFIRMKATKVGSDTTFSQIVKLVEEASSSKAPIAKMADKIAGIFVPIVIGIALVCAIIWVLLGQPFEFALSCAICVLVISCPCALGLATPVAIMVGTGKGAEHGILIKSGEALETAHNIQTIVLDKTGTITVGKPMVTDILCSVPHVESFLQIAGSLEYGSEHPLAEAIRVYAAEQNISLHPFSGYQTFPGLGIQALYEGISYYAGNLRFMNQLGISTAEWDSEAETMANQGKTPLFFATEKKMIGMIAVSDSVKPSSAKAIRTMKKMGLRVIMLTGDNQRTAEYIRKQLDLDEVIAEMLPQEKTAKIKELQSSDSVVAMVGDGINDAPALATANVGFAIGSGTDIALESADIVLLKNSLIDVVTAIQLSKATIRNIKQNLFWAFFYNALCIPLAAGLYYLPFHILLNPMIGAACMSFSSVFVVSNALRLRKFKPHFEEPNMQNSVQEQDFKVSVHTNFGNNNIPYDFGDSALQQEEGDFMKKTMIIEGMMCQHCSKAVSNALNALEGVTCQVDLGEKTAHITTTGAVSDEAMIQAVTACDYQVVSLTDAE